MSERRFQYEADVKQDPLNYDSWFDYIRLEEAAGQPDRVCFRPRHSYNRLPSMANLTTLSNRTANKHVVPRMLLSIPNASAGRHE